MDQCLGLCPLPAVGDHRSIPKGWDQSAVTASLTNPNDPDTPG